MGENNGGAWRGVRKKKKKKKKIGGCGVNSHQL